MKKLWNKLTKNKPLFYIGIFIFLILTVATFYLIYNLTAITGISGIGMMVKNGAMIALLLFWILFILFFIRFLSKNKKKKYTILLIGMILYSIVLGYIGYQAGIALGNFGKMSSNKTTYSASLVSLKEKDYDSIKDVKNQKLGMITDKNSIEGYEIANEIIKKEKLAKENIHTYDSFIALIQALYDKEIEAAFLPTNYAIMFKSIENFEQIEAETKILFSQSKTVKKETATTGKALTKPFTVLLMGVDSELENIRDSSFNGDSLMLITFNPTTLNATIMSIPRDTYVPIACFNGQRKNKITHAAWYGEDCMIKTIQNFTGINIDYYVKLNFKGLVKLVDTLGGVEVDVPYSFCEQDSNRRFGENTIYVRKGLQNLNGEQALALSRNRHPWPSMCSSEWTNYNSNDFIRGQNQQLVVKALLNKAKTIRSLSQVQDLLNVLSQSMETNMSTTEMFSLYNVAEDILLKSKEQPVEDLLSMKRLYISGIDSYIYDYSSLNGQGTELTLYNFVPYKGSLTDVITAMKVNLGLQEATIEKTFAFDVDTPYEETIVGKGRYKESNLITLLPNFVGKTEQEVRTFCNNHNLKLNVVSTTGSGYSAGKVVKQDLKKSMDIEFIDPKKGLTITVESGSSSSSSNSNNNTTSDEKPLNCMSAENKNNKTDCAIPTFTGETVAFVKNWFAKYKSYINVVYNGPTVEDEKETKITKQSTYDGTIYSLLNNTFTLTYEKK